MYYELKARCGNEGAAGLAIAPLALVFRDKLQQLLPLPEAESWAVSQSIQED